MKKQFFNNKTFKYLICLRRRKFHKMTIIFADGTTPVSHGMARLVNGRYGLTLSASEEVSTIGSVHKIINVYIKSLYSCRSITEYASFILFTSFSILILV